MMQGTRTEPEFLIDTVAINRKYAAQRDNPYRTWTGVTLVDIDCLGDMLKRRLRDAAVRFIEAMRKRSWDLEGRVYVGDPHQARNDDGTPISGKVEYRIKGGFKFASPLKTVRTEIPTGLIKRDRDHVITLSEARKAR